jgi:hypothetical protein
MRNYNVILQNYEIKDTRSVHRDTNYVTATLTVGGRLIGVPQVKFMGNQNNGTFPVGFVWSDVAVNVEANEILELNYSILNAGHPEHSKLEEILFGAAHTLGSASWAGELASRALSFGLKLVFANCDGPITPPNGRRLAFGGFGLADIAPGTSLQAAQNEPGNDSPHGCGGNSHYIVHYKIAAL